MQRESRLLYLEANYWVVLSMLCSRAMAARNPLNINTARMGFVRKSITWRALPEFEQTYRATVVGTAVPGLRGRWLAQEVPDPNGGFAVSLWDSLDAMQAYEQSTVLQQEIQPRLQPFFVGEYTTSRCDVKYAQ